MWLDTDRALAAHHRLTPRLPARLYLSCVERELTRNEWNGGKTPALPRDIRTAALAGLGERQRAVLRYARDLDGEPLRLTATARAIALERAHVSRILHDMIARNLVARAGRGVYRLTQPVEFYRGL